MTSRPCQSTHTGRYLVCSMRIGRTLSGITVIIRIADLLCACVLHDVVTQLMQTNVRHASIALQYSLNISLSSERHFVGYCRSRRSIIRLRCIAFVPIQAIFHERFVLNRYRLEWVKQQRSRFQMNNWVTAVDIVCYNNGAFISMISTGNSNLVYCLLYNRRFGLFSLYM